MKLYSSYGLPQPQYCLHNVQMRRSTGCEKCRRRKVRCDETKPGCRRCSDYGVVCPGYRPPPEQDLQFVDQTHHVARKAGSELVFSATNTELSSVVPITKNKIKYYQWRNQYAGVSAQATRPKSVDSSAVHRVQLLGTFLDLYLPKHRDGKTMSHFAYIEHLPDVDVSTPILQIAIDTLCLVEIGSLFEDEKLLHEARVRYVRALPMLANELARPKAHQIRKDHVLAAITVLALCELFDAIAQGNQGCSGWISHVNGGQRYIESHGAQALGSDFGRLLFHNIRHSSLCMGLVRRKASSFARPEWLEFTRETARTDPYVALYSIALQIPGLLERADLLMSSTELDQDFNRVCTDMCSLRKELDAWMRSWYLDMEREPYSIVDVRTMREFSTLCFERLFQTVYSFVSVQACSQFQLYWISCMLLDYTLLNLYRFHGQHHELPPMIEFTIDRTSDDVERELFVAATSYCRSMPYSCEPEVASIGRVGTFLLRICQSYFEQCGHCNELEWCRGVRHMLEHGGQNPSLSNDEKDHKKDSRPRGPWNVKHKCKSPQCSFFVRCCAPTPQLLVGEYGYAEYAPHHPSPVPEQAGKSRYRALRSSGPSPQDLDLDAYKKPLYPLGTGKTIQIGDPLSAQSDRPKRKGPMHCRIVMPNRKQNGTSVLADGRLSSEMAERTVLPQLEPKIGPVEAVAGEVYRPQVVNKDPEGLRALIGWFP